MKEDLIEQIEHYSIILDDYINKRFKYTLDTEYLEDEDEINPHIWTSLESYISQVEKISDVLNSVDDVTLFQ